MKIFISWSGERSLAVAKALKDWIPKVNQRADDLWISTEDISKGSSWNDQLAGSLERTDFGIVCITPENQTSAWLLYEAGALSKHRKAASVCTFLFDIQPADILNSPFANFQHTKATDREDVFRMMRDINKALQEREEKSLSSEGLKDAFDRGWLDLEGSLQAIPSPQIAVPTPPKESEKIDEILTTVRELARRVSIETRNEKLLNAIFHSTPQSASVSQSNIAAQAITHLATVNYVKDKVGQTRFQQLERERKKDPTAQAMWEAIIRMCEDGNFIAAINFFNGWWRQYSGGSD